MFEPADDRPSTTPTTSAPSQRSLWWVGGAAPGEEVDTDVIVVGVIADPDYPSEIATPLLKRLPELLNRRVDANTDWQVRTISDALTAGVRDTNEILDTAKDHREAEGWDIAIYLTDVPIRSDNRRPVIADTSTDRAVAGISLPALGALFLRRRVRDVVVALIGSLTGHLDTAGIEHGAHRRRRIGRWVMASLRPVRNDAVPSHRIDERFTATRGRGRARLMLGMVRSNCPGRLVLGMSSALAATMATSAFMLLSSTVWQVATALPIWRLLLAVLAAIAATTAWVVHHHRLWESPRVAADREEAWLYNGATLLSIIVGVVCMAAVVFVIDLAAAVFVLDTAALGSTVGHQPELGDLVALAAFATAAATIAGAVGSSLETEDAVRRAAYGYRERGRRAEQDHHLPR